MGYSEDRQWSDQYEPQLRAVIGQFMPVAATFRLDATQATDFIVYQVKSGPRAGQPVGQIGARLRRPGNFWRRTYPSPVSWGVQFTIRSWRSTGTETELSKIMKGFGDWFAYGHIEQTALRHWMVLDLQVFRENAGQVNFEQQDNKDGTFFYAYDVRSFPPTIFIGASDTIKIAIEHGVDAVNPLPSNLKPRRLRPAPSLQDLVAKHGTYRQITPEAWAEFDRATEQYLDDMRNGRLEIKDQDGDEAAA